MMTIENVKLTKLWIERFVIGLCLCPFAHFSFNDDTIYYEESSASKASDCMIDLMKMIGKINKVNPSEISNAFLLFQEGLTFEFMLALKNKLDSNLEKNELDEVFQTVVFHPEFQYADENFHAAGNFTNRSPLPMIHILRVSEVAHAIEITEDVDQIPIRNKNVLEALKIRHISEVFEDDFIEKIQPYI